MNTPLSIKVVLKSGLDQQYTQKCLFLPIMLFLFILVSDSLQSLKKCLENVFQFGLSLLLKFVFKIAQFKLHISTLK